MKQDLAAWRKLSPADRLRSIRGTRIERVFAVERKTIDQAARTAWISIASDLEYQRWWGVEILDMAPSSIRTVRLDAGLSICVDHDTTDLVGIANKYQISPDNKLRVLARFSKSARGEEIFQDVLDGIRVHTSVGYIVHDLILEKQEGDVSFYRVTDWEPLEGSLVAVPADPTVGVGRSIQTKSKGKTVDKDETTPAVGREVEYFRVNSLLAAGDQFATQGGPELARELVEEPTATVDTFKARMFERMRGKTRPFATAQPGGDLMEYGAGAREILPPSKCFRGADGQKNAFAAGTWLKALYGNEQAKAWCAANGMEVRAMSANTISAGGATVPANMSATIIDLMDAYGQFRANADTWPMTSDTLMIPRSVADPGATFVGESDALSEDQGSWDMVRLSTKKIGTIVRVPTELMEDSVISIADRVAFQLARAFAKTEDGCGFNGDGTSTYGGMQGIFQLLIGSTHTAGKVTAATNHDTFSEIDQTDLASVIAALPAYAHDGAKWYCSQVAWALVFFRLMTAVSGNRVGDVAGSVPKMYGGYPVVVSPVLPAGATTSYTAKTMLAFGNLRMASSFGSRRDLRIQILTERYADYDQIGIQGTERFDIINHDVGNTTTAGPIVGLVGA